MLNFMQRRHKILVWHWVTNILTTPTVLEYSCGMNVRALKFKMEYYVLKLSDKVQSTSIVVTKVTIGHVCDGIWGSINFCLHTWLAWEQLTRQLRELIPKICSILNPQLLKRQLEDLLWAWSQNLCFLIHPCLPVALQINLKH